MIGYEEKSIKDLQLLAAFSGMSGNSEARLP